MYGCVFQVLTRDTIPSIKAIIVCGAANNQLGCEDDNQLMVDEDITYVPDYLANRMVGSYYYNHLIARTYH